MRMASVGKDDQCIRRQLDLRVNLRTLAPVAGAALQAPIDARPPTLAVASVQNDVNVGFKPSAEVARQGEAVPRDDKETANVSIHSLEGISS